MYDCLKHILYSLVPWGTDVLLWVQSRRTPWLDPIFVVASLDTRGALFGLFLPLIYWSIERPLGLELIYLNILAQFVTALVKLAFAMPRPGAAGLIPYGAMPESFSFPSGHAQVSVTIFGYLAIRTHNPWLRLLWLSFIPLISFSRIYRGVHYPQDVIGGILFGFIAIGLFRWLYPPISARLKQRPTRILVVGSLLLPFSLFLVQLIVVHQVGSQPPALLASALLAGTSLGLIVETRQVGFVVEGTLFQRMLRFVAGLILIGAGYGLMEIANLFLNPISILSYVITWLQYAWVGCGLTFGAPWLFLKLGLCRSSIAAN